MAIQVLFPENSPIVRVYDETLGRYVPDHRGNKYVYWYLSNPGTGRDPGPAGLNIMNAERDWHYTTDYAAPTALAATDINPLTNFKAKWTFPEGITQAKLFVLLDAEGKTVHPDYAGVIVDNITELTVNIAISGQYVAYTLISYKDGVPVSLSGNTRVVALESLADKAAAMGLTYKELNNETFIGTVTKNQAGLYSDSAQQAAQVAGAGYYQIPVAAFPGGVAYDFDAAADNKAIEFFLTYKLSSVAGQQRIIAMSSTTSGVNCTLQYATSDAAAPADDMRFFFRDNAAGNKWDLTITDTRTTATRAVFIQVVKVGGNWVGKVYDRVSGGSAAQRGTTQTVAVSGQVLFNILSVMAWERTGVTNYASGKVQPFAYGIDKAPSTEVQILDLLNTLTLAA